LSEGAPPGPRIQDVFRPERLFAEIHERPLFVVPILVLIASIVVYTQTAIGPALPRVIPQLLDRSFATQDELVRTFRLMILTVSFLAPVLFVVGTATVSWIVLRAFGARQPFSLVLSLFAHASLWVAVGFLVRAALVLVSGKPEPSTNLAYFISPHGLVERVALAFTNPFLWLALAWTTWGLRRWGTRSVATFAGGALPWIAWIVIPALGAGSTSRFSPSTPVSYEGWQTLDIGTIRVTAPPDRLDDARELATIVDGFARRLAARYEFEPRTLRMYTLPDHTELERAAGVFLHVRTISSIRGQELFYVELPGMSAAFTRDRMIREAMRTAARMQLQTVPALRKAPSWFLEGISHAAAIPGSRELEADYEAMLQRTRPSGLSVFEAPLVFSTPEGPLLARSVVDHLAFRFGPDALDGILADLEAGTDFRDAIFARTHLTLGALETSWLDSVHAILARTLGTPPDNAATGDAPTPFRPQSGR
jgi:hypothetical protein